MGLPSKDFRARGMYTRSLTGEVLGAWLWLGCVDPSLRSMAESQVLDTHLSTGSMVLCGI